jgi:hypothetical protein
MENIYDMEAMYLYCDGWGYRIGKIQKVNDKSIRMDFGTKIPKEDFKDVYKLSPEDIEIFNRGLIKKLSNSVSKIKEIVDLIRVLRQALSLSEFSCVDSSKLQDKLDLLSDVLSEELKPMILNNEKYDFKDYSERLDKIEEKVEE